MERSSSREKRKRTRMPKDERPNSTTRKSLSITLRAQLTPKAISKSSTDILKADSRLPHKRELGLRFGRCKTAGLQKLTSWKSQHHASNTITICITPTRAGTTAMVRHGTTKPLLAAIRTTMWTARRISTRMRWNGTSQRLAFILTTKSLQVTTARLKSSSFRRSTLS